MATKNLVENYIDPINYGKTPAYERKQGERNWKAAMSMNGTVKVTEPHWKDVTLEQIVQRLHDLKLTRAELSALTGINNSDLSRTLAGHATPEMQARRLPVIVNHLWGDGSRQYEKLTNSERGRFNGSASKRTVFDPMADMQGRLERIADDVKAARNASDAAVSVVKVLEKRVADLKYAQSQIEKSLAGDNGWQEQVSRTNAQVDALRREIVGFRELLMQRGAQSVPVGATTLVYEAADRQAAVDALTSRVRAKDDRPWWRRLFG